MVKRIKKNSDNANNNVPTIIVENKECVTDEQKAEALANTFRLTSSFDN